MTLPLRRIASPLTALLAALLASSAATAAPTWITVGERAHALLARVAPAARTLSSRDVTVLAPAQRHSPALVTASERVYAVEIDDEQLPALSTQVHEELHRCGGYAQHASMAEALAVLHRLQGTPQAAPDVLAPSYVINNQALVTGMLPQLQASNILSTISSLAAFQNRRYQSSHGVAASNWLYTQWLQLAGNGSRRDVRVSQFTHPNWIQKSVSLEFSGSSNSGEVIVIGAHLDSIAGGGMETARAPGADDDASGVATMTEIIRVLMANNYRPERGLRFVAYAAEEVGLLGSREVVASYRAERRKVVGVMQLDMTAYQGTATDLWIYTDYTDPAQNAFLVSLANTYMPQLTIGYDRCGYGCSDHASWFNAGYIASFPFESSFSTDNPTIHTANDTIATFGSQANHALKFAQLGLAYALELTADPAPAPKPVAVAKAAR